MLRDVFGYENIKPWQQAAIKTVYETKGAIVALSRPTGDGKTLVIKGCAMALAGITLLITPNITLTGFMTEDFRESYFDVVNLDNLKSEEAKRTFKKELGKLFKDPKKAEKQRLVVSCSPHTLAHLGNKGWCCHLVRLAKKGILRQIVFDEVHLAVQQGRTFRQEIYEAIGEHLFKRILKHNIRPRILLVSATLRRSSIAAIQRMWGTKLTHAFLASPKEMSCRNIRIRMLPRDYANTTSNWKPEVKSKFLEHPWEDPSVGKFVIACNSKSRVATIVKNIIDAASGTQRSNIYPLSIDGDMPSMQKQATISLYCGQVEDSMAPNVISLAGAMATTASSGSEGYNNRQIQNYYHEGAPFSEEQMRLDLIVASESRGKYDGACHGIDCVKSCNRSWTEEGDSIRQSQPILHPFFL